MDQHKFTFVEKKDADCTKEEDGKESNTISAAVKKKEYYYYDEETNRIERNLADFDHWGIIEYDQNPLYMMIMN
ncbi:MAG: hypothetical protein V8S53_00250 [Lachnospiraceae bacterium]